MGVSFLVFLSGAAMIIFAGTRADRRPDELPPGVAAAIAGEDAAYCDAFVQVYTDRLAS